MDTRPVFKISFRYKYNPSFKTRTLSQYNATEKERKKEAKIALTQTIRVIYVSQITRSIKVFQHSSAANQGNQL